jgi:two-component system OmpR family sensor kinase/two-component system sensor histidine kinase BaeS
MRRHFVRRVGLMLALFFGLTFVASALAVAFISGAIGPGRHRGLVLPAAILALLLLLIAFSSLGRGMRRIAGRVADVMEAADRVAAGDYTVRVEERGPREMRRLIRSFNAMTKRLESSEEQRRSLLADLAHELRTPLSVIQGTVEGMLDGVYAPDRTHLDPVLEETRVMARLLDDLRTLSTAEAGALRLHRESVEPNELVEDSVAAFRSPAETEGVSIDHRVAEGLPRIDVDRVRIAEVLANLLANALMHTPPGGSIIVTADQAADGRVGFEVNDTGSGIGPDALPHVFDRFVKEPGSRGAGLGLAIAKSLVEAHDGEISARSEIGVGTTVSFWLPPRGDRAG